MAMLRVSSYRKLFEHDRWSGQRGSKCKKAVRVAAGGQCRCLQINFEDAHLLNKEVLDRFMQERSTISALNDRLVKIIELTHCLEEENESLERQRMELEENLNNAQNLTNFSTTSLRPNTSLDAVVGRLRSQTDEILCDTAGLKEELEYLKKEHGKVTHERTLIHQAQQDISEDIDAMTAECLALREQVVIHEEQLANMETRHNTEVEDLLKPDERTLNASRIHSGSPDMALVLNVKDLYCQLAESLQFEYVASSSGRGDGRNTEMEGSDGSMVKDLPEINDLNEMKTLIAELQNELHELGKSNDELEDEIEIKKASHTDEVAELEFTIDEMQNQEEELKTKMKEVCDEYKALLREKMARHMEISAYRSLVEEEKEGLCSH